MEICFKIAQTYKNCYDFKKSTVYLENALEIAVKLNDRYNEMIALDKIGMCYFYKGNTTAAYYYHSNILTLENINSR